MQFLKADTAATILIGPFLDKGDGVTPEEGITLAAADSAELMKHDGTTFVDLTSDSRTFTHREKGMYTLVLGTGDTDTEGRLTVFISDESVCLPVWKDFMVVNANVYDSLYAVAATDYLRVDALQLGGATQSATDLKDLADTGYDPSTHKVQGVVLADTTTAVTNDVGITQAGADKAWGTAARILTANTNFNDPTAATVADAVWDETITGHDGAGKAGQQLWTDIDAILTDTGTTLDDVVDAIKTVTDALPDAGALNDLAAILTDTDTTIPGLIAALNNVSTAQVNAEVVDALGTDTLSELSQGIPSATPTIKAALMLLYMIARNKLTTTSSELAIYNDAGTKIAKKDLTDDGTTFTEAEMASGA